MALSHALEGLRPTPVVMRKKVDPMKLRGRAYGLGERNPKTLPGAEPSNERPEENHRRSKAWTSFRKLVQSGASSRQLDRAARSLG